MNSLFSEVIKLIYGSMPSDKRALLSRRDREGPISEDDPTTNHWLLAFIAGFKSVYLRTSNYIRPFPLHRSSLCTSWTSTWSRIVRHDIYCCTGVFSGRLECPFNKKNVHFDSLEQPAIKTQWHQVRLLPIGNPSGP